MPDSPLDRHIFYIEINIAKSEKERLNQKTMEKEILELKREIERLNTIDSIRRKSIKTLERSNKKLTIDQANLIEKCEKYQKQYSKEKSMRLNIERSQDTVTVQINESQSELKKSKRVICDLMKQNNELTSENKELTKLVDTQVY